MAEEINLNKVQKTWCMTWHNYTEDSIQKIKDLEGVNLLTIGKEVGENGNTPHLQVSITFKKACRWSQIKKIFPGIHITPAISPDWSHNYCIKEDKYIRIDNRNQGCRNDIRETATTIAQKGLKAAIIEKPEMYIKYHSGMEKLNQFLNSKKRDFKPEVIWIYGKTGTGKTRYVFEKEPDLWISGKNLEWWQGYEGQEATLFDDFRGDFCTFHELLRILDRYPYTVMVKGGSRELCSKRMYITCPEHPKDVYQTVEDKGQLLRRIDKIIKLKPSASVTNVTNVTEVDEGNTSLINQNNIQKKLLINFD